VQLGAARGQRRAQHAAPTGSADQRDAAAARSANAGWASRPSLSWLPAGASAPATPCRASARAVPRPTAQAWPRAGASGARRAAKRTAAGLVNTRISAASAAASARRAASTSAGPRSDSPGSSSGVPPSTRTCRASVAPVPAGRVITISRPASGAAAEPAVLAFNMRIPRRGAGHAGLVRQYSRREN